MNSNHFDDPLTFHLMAAGLSFCLFSETSQHLLERLPQNLVQIFTDVCLWISHYTRSSIFCSEKPNAAGGCGMVLVGSGTTHSQVTFSMQQLLMLTQTCPMVIWLFHTKNFHEAFLVWSAEWHNIGDRRDWYSSLCWFPCGLIDSASYPTNVVWSEKKNLVLDMGNCSPTVNIYPSPPVIDTQGS